MGKPLPSSSQIGSIDVKQEGFSHQDQTVGAGEKITHMSSELQFSPKLRHSEKEESVFFLPTVAGRSQQFSQVPLWQEQLYPPEADPVGENSSINLNWVMQLTCI